MEPKNNTVNRGWLKRQVEKGLMEARCLYSYDYQRDTDTTGGDEWLPARISAPTWKNVTGGIWMMQNRDIRDGFINFDASDFSLKGGSAWMDEHGFIHLFIHSNSSFLLRRRRG